MNTWFPCYQPRLWSLICFSCTKQWFKKWRVKKKRKKKIRCVLNWAEIIGRMRLSSWYPTVSSRRSGGRKTYLISSADRKEKKNPEINKKRTEGEKRQLLEIVRVWGHTRLILAKSTPQCVVTFLLSPSTGECSFGRSWTIRDSSLSCTGILRCGSHPIPGQAWDPFGSGASLPECQHSIKNFLQLFLGATFAPWCAALSPLQQPLQPSGLILEFSASSKFWSTGGFPLFSPAQRVPDWWGWIRTSTSNTAW